MIVFLAEGRLGNQIFQYVCLKKMQKNNEMIIVSGFEDLKEVFEIDDIINLNKKNKWIKAFIVRIISPIITFLSDKNILSSISINYEKVLDIYRRESSTFDIKIGILKNITFVKLGYFQNEKFFDKKTVDSLKIKDIYKDKASEILSIIPYDNHKVFIHIRRGDYKDFTFYGKSTLLPMSYYEERITWFLENREDCFFIFLSDEPKFIQKEFGHIKNKLISTENYFGTDFSIMTLCRSAILSPSSFGWWGSYLMKDRDIVFAPKYWLAFNSGKDSGINISNCPSFAIEVTIND